MLQGPINQSNNQRTISIALAFLFGLVLLFGIFDLEYSLWGQLTVGRVIGLAMLYIAVALYRKWY